MIDELKKLNDKFQNLYESYKKISNSKCFSDMPKEIEEKYFQMALKDTILNLEDELKNIKFKYLELRENTDYNNKNFIDKIILSKKE